MPNPADMAQSRGDVMREIEDLKRQIRELRAERRLESATIGRGGITVQGGSVQVIEGGSVRVVDGNGTLIALLGDLDEILPGQRGFWLGRPGPSPSEAISVAGTGTGGDLGFVGVWDRDGTYIVTDDAESGRGLGRPYLSGTLGDITVPTATTTSGTFSDLQFGVVPLHHPVLYASLLVYSSTSATTGEVRLMVNGSQEGPTLSVAGDEFAFRDLGPVALASPGPYDQLNNLSVQARRTAGAGTIGVRVLSLLGLESAYA